MDRAAANALTTQADDEAGKLVMSASASFSEEDPKTDRSSGAATFHHNQTMPEVDSVGGRT